MASDHRLVAVRVLAALGLRFDDDAARQMGDADRRIGLVDVLAAGTLSPHGLKLQLMPGQGHAVGDD